MTEAVTVPRILPRGRHDVLFCWNFLWANLLTVAKLFRVNLSTQKHSAGTVMVWRGECAIAQSVVI